jgi:hypothetical protein
VDSSDFAASLEARREMWMAPSSSGSGTQSKQLALPKDAKFPYPQIGGAEALGASFPDALNPLERAYGRTG